MQIKPLITLLSLSVISTTTFAFDAKLADSAWDGKTIPAAEQCQKFGGISPATPKLALTELPKGTDTIVMEYSDRDSENMNHGGHGKISYSLSSATDKVEIPPLLGHTFNLPKPFTMIAAHRAPKWDTAGAYMPPCSGGKGHAYYVTIKAEKGDKVLATQVLELGKY